MRPASICRRGSEISPFPWIGRKIRPSRSSANVAVLMKGMAGAQDFVSDMEIFGKDAERQHFVPLSATTAVTSSNRASSSWFDPQLVPLAAGVVGRRNRPATPCRGGLDVAERLGRQPEGEALARRSA